MCIRGFPPAACLPCSIPDMWTMRLVYSEFNEAKDNATKKIEATTALFIVLPESSQ